MTGDRVNANTEGDYTRPMPCSSLRKGGYVVMQKEHPCKIMDIATSKPGKHGSAKVRLMSCFIRIVLAVDPELIPPPSHFLALFRLCLVPISNFLLSLSLLDYKLLFLTCRSILLFNFRVGLLKELRNLTSVDTLQRSIPL